VVEDLVAAFEVLEVGLKRQFPALQHCAHRALSNDATLVHRVKKELGTGRTGDRINVERKTGHIERVRVGSDTLRSISVYYDGWSPRGPPEVEPTGQASGGPLSFVR